MTVADRVKQRREELMLTQEDLAIRCGLKSKTTICKLERAGNNIGLRSIKKLAVALDVDISYLIGFDEKDAEESGEFLADLAVQPELLSYVKKLYHMNDVQRGRVYGYIDMLLEKSKK